MVRKITYTFCVFFLFTSSNYSQWSWQNPLPQGNEIATLVNTEKTAGEYEVEFDGIGL